MIRVLIDTNLEAAKAFGISFEMPENLIDLYKSFGNGLSVVSDRLVNVPS